VHPAAPANAAGTIRRKSPKRCPISCGKLAETAANLDVKSAAAEALGALNLRSEQIKALIVNQAR
jgi:hypothetical protein